MNKKELNWKEARELVIQPGKGRYALLATVLEQEEIMEDSIALLLYRVCSRLELNREQVGYNGFYCWVRNYRQNHSLEPTSADMEENKSIAKSSAPFHFSDPTSINNYNSDTDIKFH